MSIKQDTGSVRTATDIEKKYDLGSIYTIKKAVEQTETGLTELNADTQNFYKAINSAIDNIEEQLDGKVSTYYYSGVPSLETVPTSEWEQEEYENHIGDIYYDKDTGLTYIFQLNEDTYEWVEIVNSDLTEALAIANAAYDTADSKRQVFISTPEPPYENGDLWYNEGELYVCQISKEAGSEYEEDDFIALEYATNTIASELENELIVVKDSVTQVITDNESLTLQFTTTTNLVDSNTNRIEEEIATRTAMIRPTTDSEGNPVVELGATDNPVKAEYKNDGMYIKTNGVTTSYWANGTAYNTNIRVENQLRIGNFAFVPRANGNMSLKYIGGDE